MKKFLLLMAVLVFSLNSNATIGHGPHVKTNNKMTHLSPVYGTYEDVGSVAFNPDLVDFSADYNSCTGAYTLSVTVKGSLRLLQITLGSSYNSNTSMTTNYGYWYGGTFYIDGGSVLLPVNSVYTSDSTSDGPVILSGPGSVQFHVNMVDEDNNDMGVIYTVNIP